RHLQQVEHVPGALHLRLQRVLGRQQAQPPPILPVELPDELPGPHALAPSLSRRGSPWVSVSLVTTRAHRGCQACVCRASACVVKPSTAAPSSAANTRSWSSPAGRSIRTSRGLRASDAVICSGVLANSTVTPARRPV